MRNFVRFICLTVIMVLMGACSGTMDGVIRNDGTRVTFEYEQGLDRDYYKANIDGENFNGQAVQSDARTSTHSNFDFGTVYTSSSSGKFVAVMFGDRGSTLRCNMNYADSSGFTTSGGVGVCEHSDGRIIDIMW